MSWTDLESRDARRAELHRDGASEDARRARAAQADRDRQQAEAITQLAPQIAAQLADQNRDQHQEESTVPEPSEEELTQQALERMQTAAGVKFHRPTPGGTGAAESAPIARTLAAMQAATRTTFTTDN